MLHVDVVTWLGPHLNLTFLRASVLVPAPHSLRTAPRAPLVPMSQRGGAPNMCSVNVTRRCLHTSVAA